jgi:hypothetical protein
VARFVPGRPITTEQPFIDVDAGLSIGTHRFQLVVVDEQGNRSLPDIRTVTVVRAPIPTPIEPLGPIRPSDPVAPVRPIDPIDPIMPSPVRPVRRPRGTTKPPGSTRPGRGGTQ